MQTVKEYFESREIEVPEKVIDLMKWQEETGIPETLTCTRCGTKAPTLGMGIDEHGKAVCYSCMKREQQRAVGQNPEIEDAIDYIFS